MQDGPCGGRKGKESQKASNVKAAKLYSTGAWWQAAYGQEANGLTPTDLKAARHDCAIATGIWHNFMCKTTVIELVMPGKDPADLAPLAKLKEWLLLWKSLDQEQRDKFSEVWDSQLMRMKDPTTRWSRAVLPIQTTIVCLYDLGWMPSHPDEWFQPTRGGRDVKLWKYKADSRQGPCRFLATVRKDIAHRLWDGVVYI